METFVHSFSVTVSVERETIATKVSGKSCWWTTVLEGVDRNHVIVFHWRGLQLKILTLPTSLSFGVSSSTALRADMSICGLSVCPSTTLVQIEISHHLLNELLIHFMQTFMVPRWWILMTFPVAPSSGQKFYSPITLYTLSGHLQNIPMSLSCALISRTA